MKKRINLTFKACLAISLSIIGTSTPVLALPFKKGDNNQQITNIQRCLQRLGYLKTQPNGNFGPATETAVIRFQQDNDLPPNGIVNAQTQQFLNRKCENKAPSQPLKRGSRGAAVKKLQEDLRRLGYNSPVTEFFGPETEQAVKKFQQSRKIAANGVADQRTLNLIQIALSTNCSSPGQFPVLRFDDKGPCVTKLQQLLKYNEYYNMPLTDYFGRETEQAVRRFEQNNELQPDGIADASVWNMMISRIRKPSSRRVLSFADKGDDVREVQERLRQMGLFKGSVDGNFNSSTMTAIIALQRRASLPDTGVVDLRTWQALGLIG